MITLHMLDETTVQMNTESGSPVDVRYFSIQPYSPAPASFSEYPVTVKPKVLELLGVSLAQAVKNIKDKYNSVPIVAFIGTSGAATAAVIGQQDHDLCNFMHVNKDGDSANSHRGGIRTGDDIPVLECPTHFVLTDEHVSSGNTLAGVILKVVKWYQGQVSIQHRTKYYNREPDSEAPEVSQEQLWDNLHIHIAVPLTHSRPAEIINTICGTLRWVKDVTPELYQKIQNRIVSLSGILEPQLNVNKIQIKNTIEVCQNIPTEMRRTDVAPDLIKARVITVLDASLIGIQDASPMAQVKSIAKIGKTMQLITRLDSRNPLW